MIGLWLRIVAGTFLTWVLLVSLAYGAGSLIPTASLYFLFSRETGNHLYVADTHRGNLFARASYLLDYTPFTISPDRRYLAFIRVASIQIEIVIVDLAEDQIHQTVDNIGNRIGPLAWSPDSQSLAYTSNQRGTNDLYTFNLMTSERRWLAENVAVDVISWSPDGQKIAFVSSEAAPYTICAAKVDGSTPRCLPRRGARNGANGPAWSPDGEMIAYSADYAGNTEVYLIPVECLDRPSGCEAQEQRLTSSPTIDVGPVWSPDGQHLAYVSNQGGVRGVFIMRRDGSGTRRVSPYSPGGYWTNWSPDSQSVAFLVGLLDNPQIYVADINTGDYRRLTDPGFVYQSPVWAP